MNGLVALVALVAAGLVGVVGYELWSPATEVERAPVAVGAPGVSTAPVAVAGREAVNDDALLARPLFSQTRRPPDVAGPVPTVAGGGEPLPRMTGILIDGPTRRAIFAGGPGKAVTVVEGGRVGAFTVQFIGARQVTLVGPNGPQTVRPTFDANLAAPAPLPGAGFLQPQFPGIQVPGIQVPGTRLPGGAIFPSQTAVPGFDAGTGSLPGAAR